MQVVKEFVEDGKGLPRVEQLMLTVRHLRMNMCKLHEHSEAASAAYSNYNGRQWRRSWHVTIVQYTVLACCTTCTASSNTAAHLLHHAAARCNSTCTADLSAHMQSV